MLSNKLVVFLYRRLTCLTFFCVFGAHNSLIFAIQNKAFLFRIKLFQIFVPASTKIQTIWIV